MAIINRHVGTIEPHPGLGPYVLNLPSQWVGFPAASASNNVYTATQQTAGSSAAPGTQPDYARNVVVVITPTASSAGVTGGGVTIYGRDLYGSARSESFGSLAATSAVGLTGSVNFLRIDTISAQLSFLTASSSAASAFAVNVGVGQKLGLPVFIRSTNAVPVVHYGTALQQTFSGATSTNNQYTAVTGNYFVGGIRLSSAYNSASLLQINYMNLGRLAPRPGIEHG